MADDGLDELDALLASLDDGPKEPEVVIDDPELAALFADGSCEKAADEVEMKLYKSFVSLKREFKHVHAPSASEGLKAQAIEEFVKCLDSLVTSIEVDRAVSFTGVTGIEKDLIDLNATLLLAAVNKRLESRKDPSVISTYLREEVDPTEFARQLEVVAAFARPDAGKIDLSAANVTAKNLKSIKNARLNFKYTAMEESPDWLRSHAMDEFLESMDEIVMVVEAQRLQHVEGGGVLKNLEELECSAIRSILEDRLVHQSDDSAVIGRIKNFELNVIEEDMKKYCVFLGGEE